MGSLLGGSTPPPTQTLKMVKPDTKVKPLEGSVSPDTEVVKDGVNKVMKKGRASTIVTGVMGDESKAKIFKPLLGGY